MVSTYFDRYGLRLAMGTTLEGPPGVVGAAGFFPKSLPTALFTGGVREAEEGAKWRVKKSGVRCTHPVLQ